MKKFCLWVAGGVLLLCLVLAGLFAWSRSLPRDSDALVSMQAPATTPGANAFGALWLMDYDVPADEVASIVAEDVARFTAAAPVVALRQRCGTRRCLPGTGKSDRRGWSIPASAEGVGG